MERSERNESPNPKHQSQHSGIVKLFVGGLTGEMTREALAGYFSDFAQIIDSFVVYESHKPAGFGFITVKDKEEADKILQKKHFLNNSILDVKPALDRTQAKDKEENERKRKIFVGGLPKNFQDESLKEFFERFGPIQKCYVVKDPLTGKTRGFGFVIFSTDKGYNDALKNPNMSIGGGEAHVKAATSKHEPHYPKDSVKPFSPSTKKYKKSKNQTNEVSSIKRNDTKVQTPVNLEYAKYHDKNSFVQESYDSYHPSNFQGGYYVNFAKQPYVHQYLQYTPSLMSNQTPMFYGSPYQYPVPPVQSATSFYSPQPVYTLGHPVQSGNKIQLYPNGGRQVLYDPSIHRSMPFHHPASKILHSTQAVAYRRQDHTGEYALHANAPPSPFQPTVLAKSAHAIDPRSHRFAASSAGHGRSPQKPARKYAENPFGAQEEDEEDASDSLKRAGDF